MSDPTAPVNPDPALRKHAQAFYDAVRTNNIAVMEDMVNKGFPLSWAHAFSPESLPEYALAHRAPDAAWWLLAHDVAPASWGTFASKAGRSFLSYGLDLVIHRSSTVSASAYVRLASRLAREAGGQLPLAASALIERLAIKEAMHDVRDEAIKAASDLRSQSAGAFEAIKEKGRDVLGDIRQATQRGLDTPEVKKAAATVRSWRDRLLDGSAAAALRKTWEEKVAPVFRPESDTDSDTESTSSSPPASKTAPASPAVPPAHVPAGRPLPVHQTASERESVIILPSEFPATRKAAPRKSATKPAAKAATKSTAKSPSKIARKTAKPAATKIPTSRRAGSKTAVKSATKPAAKKPRPS